MAIAALAEDALLGGALPEVLLIAPCRSSFLERWTSDLEPGRRRARTTLEQSAAHLADLGVTVSTRVGDEDTAQMTEDALSGFAATELVVIDGKAGDRTAETLQPRLSIPLHRFQPADGRFKSRSALRHPGVSIQRAIRPLRTS